MKLTNWVVSISSVVLLVLCMANEASLFAAGIYRGLNRNFFNGKQFPNLFNPFPGNLPLMLPAGPDNQVPSDIEEIDQVFGDIIYLIDNSGLVLGDALMNVEGEVFFFLEKFKSDGIKSTLMKATDSNVISSPIKDFYLVKKYERELEQYLDYSSDPVVNGQFKLLQFYENCALLMSVQSGMVFVAPKDNIDGTIRCEYLKRLQQGKLSEMRCQEAENKRILDGLAAAKKANGVTFKETITIYSDNEDFLESPDTVTFAARQRQSFIQKLFRQTVSTDLFIKQNFIAMLVKKEVSLTDAMAIVLEAEQIFRTEQTVGSILIRPDQSLTVVGDIHGQFEDLLRIFNNFGWPSPTKMFLFNGDIVDRGSSSIECLLLLYVLKITFPRSLFINRGNHETETCEPCTFLRDCTKLDKTGDFYAACQTGFIALPIAHVINNRIYVVHGGIRADYSIKEISGMNRFEMSDEMRDFLFVSLWDDVSELPGLTANQERGPKAFKFGPDVTESFLQLNEFDKMIRSHTYTSEGIVESHDNKCWTLFSAPNYQKRGNIAAVVTFDSELTPVNHFFKSRN